MSTFRTMLRQLAVMSLLLAAAQTAQALPSFADQTGMECGTCHVGGFGPQLTTYGQHFKLAGYTDHKAGGSVPFAAMEVLSFTHTAKDQPVEEGAYYGSNDNIALQELSGFLAGRTSEHSGAFVQVTYSDIDRTTGLDNMDWRYARQTESALWGISINNNPTIQDVWNTVPAWGFPYMGSELVPESAASPLIAGGLEHQVIGTSVYALWNNSWYTELGVYHSLSPAGLRHLHVGDDSGRIEGSAPYERFSYQDYAAGGQYSIGMVGMQTRLDPDRSGGDTDNYNDLGVDATWQKGVNNGDTFTVNASFIKERYKKNAALAADEVEKAKGNIDSLHIDASYYFDHHIGTTLGVFSTTGSKDTVAYAPEDTSGSRSGKPDTTGITAQVDWTPFGQSSSWASPFANLRVGLQYTAYSRFNGSSSNYDGSGRSASDNNTIFLFAWMAI